MRLQSTSQKEYLFSSESKQAFLYHNPTYTPPPLIDEVILESCDVLPLEGALRLENAQGNDQPALAMVPILYTDLPGVDHEPITLFADSTTTAGYVGVCVCGVLNNCLVVQN